jgi:hypothetical protein
VVGALVTPETIVDLMDDGWPQSLDLDRPDGAEPAATAPEGEAAPPPAKEAARGNGLSGRTPSQLFALARTAEMRGFRTVVFSYPPGRPRASQFRLRLRLRGFTWRVVDLELPQDLRERISRKLIRLPRRLETLKPRQ